MATDQQAAPTLPSSRRHASKTRLLATVLVLGLGSAAAAVVVAHHETTKPPSSPIFSGSDGLPPQLEAGASYVATMSVRVADDWANPDPSGDPSHLIAWAYISTTGPAPQWRILCSQAIAPSRLATLSCPLVAPTASGTPVDIMVTVSPPEWADAASWTPVGNERSYPHTVR